MAAQKENTQAKGQVSPAEKVRLRVSAMISSPQAQAERRASIWKAQGDSEEAWQRCWRSWPKPMDSRCRWGRMEWLRSPGEAGDEEGVEVVDGIELVQEPDMVVQRLHEERI
ncbi:DUF1654 domain-containing protein [Pseudomonas aeruginosa]